VLFFNKHEGKTIYSLNTLPLSVQIKQSLRTTIETSFDFSDDIEFFANAIKAGANSNVEKFPEAPIIFINLPSTK
jgi:hypothetical protein